MFIVVIRLNNSDTSYVMFIVLKWLLSSHGSMTRMALYGTCCGDLIILCSMYNLNVSRIVLNVNYVYITFKYTRFTINKYLEHVQYKLTNRRSCKI